MAVSLFKGSFKGFRDPFQVFLRSIGNCRGLGIFFGGSVGYRRGFRDLGVLFAAAGRQHRPPCSIACAFEVSGRVRFRD